MGVNLAMLVRILRFGMRGAGYDCRMVYAFINPFEKCKARRLRAEFEVIPVVSLESVLGERKVEVKFQMMKCEDGMMPVRDAFALLSILVAERPSEVLEIGTYMGYTTRALAENLDAGIVHTVDLPLDFSVKNETKNEMPKDDFHLINRRVVGREFKGSALERKIRQHFGDTAEIDFKQFGRPTFFFIDGAHTYEYCKNDFEKCFALCPAGGTFFWHDCDMSHPGVVRSISELRQAGHNVVRIDGTALAYWKN